MVKEGDIQKAMLDWFQAHGYYLWDGRLTTGMLKARFREQKLVHEMPLAENLVRDWRGLVWRNYVGPMLHGRGVLTPNPSAGTPDLFLVCRCGQFFGFEVKTEEGLQSPLQLFFEVVFDSVVPSHAGIFTVRSTDELAKIIGAHVCSL